MKHNINFYENNATMLAEQYNSVDAEVVHQQWKEHWPNVIEKPLSVLDVGSGSGRDALWYSNSGCNVVAIEPSAEMLKIGLRKTQGSCVSWVQDQLPDLDLVKSVDLKFDYVVVSAVWMHIPLELREVAFSSLAGLLSEGGKLVISLRHGTFSDQRIGFPVSVDELENLVKNFGGMEICFVGGQSDSLSRPDIFWETVVIQRT